MMRIALHLVLLALCWSTIVVMVPGRRPASQTYRAAHAASVDSLQRHAAPQQIARP